MCTLDVIYHHLPDWRPWGARLAPLVRIPFNFLREIQEEAGRKQWTLKIGLHFVS